MQSDLTREPPTSLRGTLSYLGPSMILSASIVGSGELIVTTTLGAEAGFVALWVILVSCVVKVCAQLEFGKHAISSGESTMAALNRLRGPMLAGTRWTLWAWLIVQVVIVFQYGGIVRAIGQSLNIALPMVPVGVGAALAGLATAAIVARGGYRGIENISIVLMVLFTGFTLICLGLLQTTEYAITWRQLSEGFSFRMPAEVVPAAVAAFGLTGVGATEVMTYPYWCLEKGYAKYTGPRDASPAWAARARGWIRVMYWDSLVSMVVYTITTAAFYLLGASVLHGRGEVPRGAETIRVLSNIYTEAAGPGAMALYLAGAVVVLFSTLVAGSAAWTRLFSDVFSQMGLLDYDNQQQRGRWVSGFAWGIPITWTLIGLAAQSPVVLVFAGGIANASLLLIVVLAAYTFRYHRLPAELRPGWGYDLLLWLSFLAITAVGVISVTSLF